MPTHFGRLDLETRSMAYPRAIDIRFRLTPMGDQARRRLEKIVIDPRTPSGSAIRHVTIDGREWRAWTQEAVIVMDPQRGREYRVRVEL